MSHPQIQYENYSRNINYNRHSDRSQFIYGLLLVKEEFINFSIQCVHVHFCIPFFFLSCPFLFLLFDIPFFLLIGFMHFKFFRHTCTHVHGRAITCFYLHTFFYFQILQTCYILCFTCLKFYLSPYFPSFMLSFYFI